MNFRKSRMLLLFSHFFFIVNCNSYKMGVTRLVYRTPTALSSYEKQSKFMLWIPEGGDVIATKNASHALESECVVSYPNGSKIYITNNYIDGSQLNIKNRIRAGLGTYRRERLFDTLSVNGINTDSLFWKEKILGDVVIGYLNVPKSSVDKFDRSLNTFKRSKR